LEWAARVEGRCGCFDSPARPRDTTHFFVSASTHSECQELVNILPDFRATCSAEVTQLWTVQVCDISVRSCHATRFTEVAAKHGLGAAMLIKQCLCTESNTSARPLVVRPSSPTKERALGIVSSVVYASKLNKQMKQTLWHESSSELHRPSHSRFSAKLLPTFADIGMSRS
jgi:hypothetical protein